MDPAQQAQQLQHIMAVMLPMILMFWVIVAVISVWLFWRIFTKAGMAGPLSLLILVPGIGLLIVICVLAFGRWNVIPAPPLYGMPPQHSPPPSYPSAA